jgi:hypothetical protein
MVRSSSTYRAQRRALARELAKQILNEPPPKRAWSHRLAISVSTAGVALFACLVIASLAYAGVIDMTSAFIALGAAWFVVVLTSAFSEPIRALSAHRRIAATLGIAMVAALFLLFVGRYEVRYRLELTSITPDTLPTPASACAVPAEPSMAIFLGSNVSIAQRFPHTVIAIGNDEHGQPYPILSIGRDSNGSVFIQNLRIFSAERKIITSVDHNEFFINSNFRSKRPDAHTLIVYDDLDREVLFLHFINSNAISVRGIFQRPPFGGFRVSDNGIEGGPRISGSCFKDSNIDFAIQ